VAPRKIHEEGDGLSDHEILLEIRCLLLGDGTEGNPGLAKKVDRLEQRSVFTNWIANTGVTAVLSVATAWVTTKLGGKP
jgi:hypothetical protein